MLTPSEKKALDCICTGQKAESAAAIWPEREPKFVIDLVDRYLQIRRCLLGGDVERYAEANGRYELYLFSGRNCASTGFVWSYSGKRPGKPVVNFTFPQIGQNSADICFHEGFTLNLLFAKQGRQMGIEVPNGWTSWQEPPSGPTTRQWAVQHRIAGDLQDYPEVSTGIERWKAQWDIR